MHSPDAAADDSAPALILDTAERLFAERGFRATTLQALSKESGLSPALPYYYYTDKTGLYHAVIERLVRSLASRGMESVSSDADPAAAVRAIVEFQAAFLLERPHAARLIAREMVDHQGQHAVGAIRDALSHLFGRLRDLIAAGQRAGRFRPDLDPTFSAISTIAQVAWFAIASPVVGVLLGGSTEGPTARQRRAFAQHAARYSLSALERERERTEGIQS